MSHLSGLLFMWILQPVRRIFLNVVSVNDRVQGNFISIWTTVKVQVEFNCLGLSCKILFQNKVKFKKRDNLLKLLYFFFLT